MKDLSLSAVECVMICLVVEKRKTREDKGRRGKKKEEKGEEKVKNKKEEGRRKKEEGRRKNVSNDGCGSIFYKDYQGSQYVAICCKISQR